MQNSKQIYSILFFILFSIITNNSFAINYKIEPSILLKSTYTDNEKLSSTDTSADIIAEITPAINISATSLKIKTDLNYSLHKQISYTQDINKLNHELHGRGDISLIKNYVNLFATGDYEQRENQINRNILLDNSPQIDDTADFGSITAGTEISHLSKKYFDAKMRYVFNIAKNNSTTVANTSSHNINSSIINGNNFHRFLWGANASYQEIDGNNTSTITNKTKIAEVTANLGYLIHEQNGFRLNIGYESNPQYTQVNPNTKSKDYITTATIFWKTPKKFNIEATAGRRAYGTTYQIKTDWSSPNTRLSGSYGRSIIGNSFSLDAQQKIRKVTFNVRYNETLSDYNYISFLPDQSESTEDSLITNVENTVPIVQTLLPTTQTGTYIIRRLSSGITLTGTKNTLDLNADYEINKYLETGSESKTYKAKAEWKYQINPLANTNASIEVIDANDLSLGATGRYGIAKLTYEHNIKKHFLTTLSVQHWKNKPDTGETITVNLISIGMKAYY